MKSTQHVEVEVKMDKTNLMAAEKKCGIIERENYNKPKSEDGRQPQCPPEKEAASWAP